ncbi:hypothetical protein FG91_00064 [Sphingopyxis sp. LC81]|uniref:hypothetical protein n=1 Tax=Sphingopyxis sp. LC81 TaxID=1502850 RepID=UPI00050DD18A|nr:hypothetical protein [Sphingopyxis sp. LC81]KGB56960.1 hypothetical protein FG91_00064 [Sphingopyxis sp. LC81]
MSFLLISLALSVTAPEAKTSEQRPETIPAPERKAGPKPICRTIIYTGSRLPQRECRTQEQWDRRADETGKWMDQYKN